MTPTLTLLCPGVLATAGLSASTSIAARWPSRWARADLIALHENDSPITRESPHEHWLRQQFGVADGDSLAAASAVADSVALPTIRLTPVHLHTGRDQLVLTDPFQMDLSRDDANALADAVRPLLTDLGLTLTVAAPMRWYLSGPVERLPAVTDIGSVQAIGRSVDAYLSRGAATRPWRRLLNEIQMIWHEHPQNQARQSQRLPAVNSLWAEGRFTKAPASRHDCLLAGDDFAVQGLAQLCESSLPAPGLAGAETWLAQYAATERNRADRAVRPSLVLVSNHWPVVDPSADPARYEAGWQAFKDWLTRLGCTDGPPAGFDRLDVVLCGDRRRVSLRIGPHQRWKLWQSHQPDQWLERLPPPDIGMPT